MNALRLLSTAVFCLTSVAVHAAVTVAFPAPETFRDASLRESFGATADEPALLEIEAHLRKLGDRFLDPSASLQLEVLDVDLAGRFEPWRPHLHGVRIMDNLSWPSIRLRYRLTRDGRVQAEGEERVSDQTYLARQRTWFSGDRLGYEKRMLDEWFRARFSARPD